MTLAPEARYGPPAPPDVPGVAGDPKVEPEPDPGRRDPAPPPAPMSEPNCPPMSEPDRDPDPMLSFVEPVLGVVRNGCEGCAPIPGSGVGVRPGDVPGPPGATPMLGEPVPPGAPIAPPPAPPPAPPAPT